MVFSLTNVWGRFWWFGFARRIVTRRSAATTSTAARVGTPVVPLDPRFAGGHGEGPRAGFYRSDESWAYDWFGPPAYHLHSPGGDSAMARRARARASASVPGLLRKDPPVDRVATLIRALTGDGPRGMGWFWLANRAPNMVHVSAIRARGPVTERAASKRRCRKSTDTVRRR